MSNSTENIPEEVPLQENVENQKPKHKSFIEKLKYVKENITVEPIFAGLIISSMLSRLAVQNLNIEKACRIKKNFGDVICDDLIHRKGNTSYEAEVQKVISDIETWRTIIQTAIPTILVIFMGAWSDRTGNRKLCIILPIIAEFLVCVSNMLSTYFFYEISLELTMFAEVIFPAITGGWVMIYLGVFSYISDITDEKSRTFRVGLANLCMTAGIPLGTSLSGILLNVLGYYGVFAVSGSINMLIIVYAVFRLSSNTKHASNSKERVKQITCTDIATLVKETGEVAVKKREGKLRNKIILTLLVVAIIYGPDHGERILIYLFVRYRLKWDALKYSFYSTYSVITHSIGALFSISVFSKRWGFHDSTLCLISITSKLAGSLAIAFVQTDFHMFMLPLIEILNATTFTSLRSMASKLVPSEELGKMNSLFSLVETLAALVFDPTYSAMYSRTLNYFAGTVFLFSAFSTLPSIGILIWFFIQNRKEQAEMLVQARLEREEIVYEKTISEECSK